MNPSPTPLQLEPIRLPAWAVTVLVIVVAPLGTAFLTNTDWKPVAVGCVAALVPMLAVAERARTQVVPQVVHQGVRAAGYAAAIDAKLEGRKQGEALGIEQGEAQGREAAIDELRQLTPPPKPARKRSAPAKKAAAKTTKKSAAQRPAARRRR